jgi:hypothetical protein
MAPEKVGEPVQDISTLLTGRGGNDSRGLSSGRRRSRFRHVDVGLI